VSLTDLLSVGAAVGLKPLEFWEITPAELSAMVDVYNQRTTQEREMVLTTAYLTAYWTRVRQMPTLDEVLGRTVRESEVTSAEGLLEMIKKANAALGGVEV
jgi:hypothetical protein